MTSQQQNKQRAIDLLESRYKGIMDEKIRKALLRFHASTIDLDGIKGKDILAWLEKQGEQKPAWTEADDEELEIAINTLKDAGQYDSADWLITLKQRIGK